MVRQSPLQSPTPTVAPVMHCVVDTGRAGNVSLEHRHGNKGTRIGDLPSRVARITVNALPSSIEKPRDGDCSVILFPRFRMML